MKKFDLTRANPKRSKKRRDQRKGLKQIVIRITPETQAAIKRESASLCISENLYINACLESSDIVKIKKVLGMSTV